MGPRRHQLILQDGTPPAQPPTMLRHASGDTNYEQYLINNINKIFPTVFETIQQLFESEVNV